MGMAMATAITDTADASRAELAAGAADTAALDALFDAGCSPATNALIRRLRDDRLDHELLGATDARAQRDLDRRSEPRPRFRSWEDEMADETGVPARGEI